MNYLALLLNIWDEVFLLADYNGSGSATMVLWREKQLSSFGLTKLSNTALLFVVSKAAFPTLDFFGLDP